MLKNVQLVFLILCCCCLSSVLYAQKDTKFWFVAPEVTQGANNDDRPVAFRFFSYDDAATITISQPANPAFPVQTLILAANSSGILELPPLFNFVENTPADAVLDKGFLIESNSLITAYYEVIGALQSNTEIFSLKGKNAMGTEFYVPFQNILDNSSLSPSARSSFDIVASEDNTSVTIIPTQDIVGHIANIPFTITLNRGETYSAEAVSQSAAGHPAGSKVSADKPIAITMKDDMVDASLAFGDFCVDLIGDQIVPIEKTGTRYVLQKGGLLQQEAAMILATADGTAISFDGNPLGVLNAGESLPIVVSDRHYIESSAPIYLLQISGDVCQLGAAIVPDLDCSGTSSIGFAKSAGDTYLLLVTQSGNEGGFTVNGDASLIQAADFSIVPGTSFGYLSLIYTVPDTLVSPGGSVVIENSLGLFQMGYINGSPDYTGASFGYFSNFDNQINIAENAQLCPGDTILVHGIPISAPGVYQDVEIDSQGCLIVTDITVTLNPVDSTFLSATTCDSTQAGIFEQTLSNSSGCDSIVIRTVTLAAPDSTFLESSTCDSTATGVFIQLFTNSSGCDSLVILTVTQAAPDSTFLAATTCDSTATGVFLQLFTNSSGCDSLVITTVALAAPDSTFVEETTCDFTQTGVFEEMFTDSSGCDSLVITTVTLAAPDSTLLDLNTCDSNQAGVFTAVFTNSNGCDSLVITTVTFVAADTTLLSLTTCDSTLVGISEVLLSNINGCDSLVITNTTFAPSDQTTINLTTCDSVQTGVFAQLFTNINGCDSLVIRIVSLVLGDSTFVNLTTCDTTEVGIFEQILSNINGCDSVITTTVTLAPIPETYTAVNLCPNDTIYIGGVGYSQPGFVIEIIPSTTGGCDTVATYELIRVDNILVEQTVSFCPGDSVLLNGVYYTQADTAISYNIPSGGGGCDTMFVITLEFGFQPASSVFVEFCPGDTVTIDGVQYTQPDIVLGTVPSATGGCDTLVTYVLEFAPQPTATQVVEFCPGDSVSIDGVFYSQPSIVNGTIPSTTGGCDTLVTYTLQFAPQPTLAQLVEFCPGDSVSIDGVNYSQPGTVSGTIPSTTGGCDTLVTYTLQFAPQSTISQTIEFCAGDTVSLGGVNYSQPGTVTLTLPATSGCDTIATYTLKFLVPSQPTSITLNCPVDIFVNADPSQASVDVTYTLPTANSDCPCPGLALNLLQGLPSGSNFPLGVTDICYNAKDSCDNSITCCFKVTVETITACDVKQIGCIRYELLSITQDNQQRKTYRIRTTNNCTNRMIYMAIQLPDGVVADLPVNNSTYTAPSGRTYLVRNPNFSPFYSVRYSSISDSIQNGESDVFKYTLPPQANPTFIHVMVKLEPQIYYEAHMNVFGCVVEYEPNPKPGQDRDVTETSFALFPNPTDGALFADLSAWNGQNLQLRVFNVQGQLVVSQRTTAGTEAQEVILPDQLSAGMYLMEVTPADGVKQTTRFVVQR